MPAGAYAFLRQIIWVLSGDLVLIEGATRHALASGDCLELGPPMDCVFRNDSSSPCVYVVAVLRNI